MYFHAHIKQNDFISVLKRLLHASFNHFCRFSKYSTIDMKGKKVVRKKLTFFNAKQIYWLKLNLKSVMCFMNKFVINLTVFVPIDLELR